MIVNKTYNDFLQLINDGQYNGYRVCFERSSIVKDSWAAKDYLGYLDNLERHKHETGISIKYDFLLDANNHVLSIDVYIHYPAENDIPERSHSMHWVIVKK